jgi:hypothetical protein
MNTARNKAVVVRLFDEIWNGRKFGAMVTLTSNDAGRLVHQRRIVDNLASLREAGVMPTTEQ